MEFFFIQLWCFIRSYVADTKTKEWVIDSMRATAQPVKDKKMVSWNAYFCEYCTGKVSEFVS
jgi:hypothetical protein